MMLVYIGHHPCLRLPRLAVGPETGQGSFDIERAFRVVSLRVVAIWVMRERVEHRLTAFDWT